MITSTIPFVTSTGELFSRSSVFMCVGARVLSRSEAHHVPGSQRGGYTPFQQETAVQRIQASAKDAAVRAWLACRQGSHGSMRRLPAAPIGGLLRRWSSDLRGSPPQQGRFGCWSALGSAWPHVGSQRCACAGGDVLQEGHRRRSERVGAAPRQALAGHHRQGARPLVFSAPARRTASPTPAARWPARCQTLAAAACQL